MEEHLKSRQPGFLAVVLLLSGVNLLLHLICLRNYGYFIDELYYLACSRHLAWGFVDQPPLCAAILRAITAVAGSSLVAIRVIPALAGAATMVFVGLLVREFGGGLYALLLAGLAVLVNPLFLFMHHYYSMNCFDILFWAGAMLLFARLLRGGDPRWWLALGLLLGLGMMNKIGVAWLAAGIFAGVVFTHHRRMLRAPWPWLGAGIALVILLPYILWNLQHGWPTLEFMRNATRLKYAGITRANFLLMQILELHPFAFPIWIIGAASLLFFKLARPYRAIGIAWLTVEGILLIYGHSKTEYIGPAVTVLLAAGGVAIERFMRERRVRRAPAAVPIALLLAGGALMAPYTLPVLPVDSFIAYEKALHFTPASEEGKSLGALPQHYADMFGWENLASTVARVCDRLPPEDRAQACVFAPRYGPAGALEQLGKTYHLPPVISGHNNYWIWGPGECTGAVVVVLGSHRDDLAGDFDTVETADTVRSLHVMPYENNIPIWICRGLHQPLREVWGDVKHLE